MTWYAVSAVLVFRFKEGDQNIWPVWFNLKRRKGRCRIAVEGVLWPIGPQESPLRPQLFLLRSAVNPIGRRLGTGGFMS
jgi:hypothetical protein